MKRPSVKGPSVLAEKSPKVSAPKCHESRPLWRLGKIDWDGPFPWPAGALREILGRLAEFESMTWSEILIVGKRQNHAVATAALCKGAHDRLVELDAEDIDELVSLRCGGKKRVYGRRHGDAYYPLWWDPGHAVYPTTKRT